MATIQKRSLVDQVYDRLRSEIITLRLPLGSKVNVNELQDTLGVSCTPIREAINRLQQEGLITYENNLGARVLTLESRDVEEIEQLATTLHCAAARLAMERGAGVEMAALLRRRIGDFSAAAAPEDQALAVTRIIQVFYLHCGNRRLDHSLLAIQGQQHLLRHLYARHGIDKALDQIEFEQMLTGVETGDAPMVCQAIQTNAERMKQAAIEELKA